MHDAIAVRRRHWLCLLLLVLGTSMVVLVIPAMNARVVTLFRRLQR